MDDSLVTCGTLTDAETIVNVRGTSEDAVANYSSDVPKLATKEVDKAASSELLTAFLEFPENVGHEGFADFELEA